MFIASNAIKNMLQKQSNLLQLTTRKIKVGKNLRTNF